MVGIRKIKVFGKTGYAVYKTDPKLYTPVRTKKEALELKKKYMQSEKKR